MRWRDVVDLVEREADRFGRVADDLEIDYMDFNGSDDVRAIIIEEFDGDDISRGWFLTMQT